MPIAEIFALFQFLLVGSITPGPNNALLSSSGMRFGYRATLPHCLGIMFGHSFVEFAAALGLGTLYQAFPIIEQVLTIVAIAILLYLAFKIATAPVEKFAEAKGHSKPWTFWQAAAFQWVNPKVWLMAIGVAGTYASAETPVRTALVIGAVTIMAGIISTQTWTIFGVAMRRVLDTPQKRRIFNVIMAALLLYAIYLMIKGN